MAKNEAKIKFTAETSEFNDSIKKSNNELSELRAELKLNEAQMKTAGASVDGLKKKHGILESQLKASQDKTEALSRKVEAAVQIFGENSDEASRLRTQLANAQTAEEKIRKAISDCNKELEEQERAAEDAAKAQAEAAAEAEAAARAQKEAERATSKLNSAIEEQQSELDQLKGKYTDAVLQYGKGSKEAKDLAKQIDKLSSELADNQKELGKAEAAADKLDKSYGNAGDAAREAADGFTVTKGVIADLASNAIQAAIGKVREFIGYLAELPEATREIRQDMATLETSFASAGLTSEQATGTWKELYKIFGEDDRAVEAANLISKMSDNQKDLNSWVNITKGIWGSYQDSLPVEGLAEASNETAKTGKVTGVLADALNWSSEAASMFSKYMSEDVTTAEDAFNEALKGCTTEQERQTLITETLTSLYGDAAKKYDEASGAQTAAKEATADNILIQNELAETLEPVTTAWQGMKNELLQGVAPAIQAVAGWLKEHPAALKAIAVGVTALSVALGVIAIAVGVYTAVQWLMNAALLACPLTWIVLAIAALIAIVVVIIAYWDELKAAFVGAWDAIKKAWGACVDFFKGIFNGIKKVFSNIGGWFKNKFSDAKNGAVNAWSNTKSKFSSVKNGIASAFSDVKEKLSRPFEKARDAIKKVADKIKGLFKFNISMPKIKLPHFGISPKGWGVGDLLKGKIPKLSIKWYSKAVDNPMILKGATIFGHSNGQYLGGGETSDEMIGGTNTVMRMIQSAVDRSVQAMNIDALASAVEDLANRPIEMNINGRRFAVATASDTDSVGGMRNSFKSRGLVLD